VSGTTGFDAIRNARAPAALGTPKRCDDIEIAVGQNERRCFKPGAGKIEYFKVPDLPRDDRYTSPSGASR
jgi:hypothetical protein